MSEILAEVAQQRRQRISARWTLSSGFNSIRSRRIAALAAMKQFLVPFFRKTRIA
jgi:hypothetical protein